MFQQLSPATPETSIRGTAVLTLRTKGHRPELLGKSLLGHWLIQQRDLNGPRDGWPVLCHGDDSRSKDEYDTVLMECVSTEVWKRHLKAGSRTIS